MVIYFYMVESVKFTFNKQKYLAKFWPAGVGLVCWDCTKMNENNKKQKMCLSRQKVISSFPKILAY